MSRLITLGGLSVRNGTVINGLANPRSRLAILAVLAVAGDRGVRREKLAALFWPESDDEKARNALRQALFTLKRDLGAGEMTLGVADLRLNPDVLTADVTDFDTAIRDERFEDAAALYHGPFLDGVFLRESREFEHWAEEHRTRLSRDYSVALEKAAAVAAARGDLRAAASWWERHSVHDPLSGRVARRFMEALAAAGDRERAIRHAAVHAQLVRQDLEAEPDMEVIRLAERLRERPTMTSFASRDAANTERAASPAAADVGYEQSGVASTTSPRVEKTSWLGSARARAAVTLAAVTGLSIFGGALLKKTSSLPPKVAAAAVYSGRVAVANFENPTDEVQLDDVARHAALTITQRLQDAVTSDLVGPLNAPVTVAKGALVSDSLLHRARELNARFLVHGAIVQTGTSLEFSARLVDVRTNEVVAIIDPVTAAVDRSEFGLAILRDRVALAVALALDGGRIPTGKLANAPTNVDALREYLTGLETSRSGGALAWSKGTDHYLAAARLDTAYTAPLVSAAMTMSTLARYAREDQRTEWQRRRDSVLHVLESRRNRLTRLDREGLAFFDAVRRGDVIAMRQSAGLAASLSPGSEWSCQAARIATSQRYYRDALQFIRQVDFEHGWALFDFNCWKYLFDPLHLLGDYSAEEAVADQYARLNPRMRARYTRALIGAGRMEEATHLAREILTQPGEISGQAKQIAEEFQAHNEFDLALAVLNATIDWIRSSAADRVVIAAGGDSSELRAQLWLREGALLLMSGRLAEARNAYTRFLPETSSSQRLCTECGWDVTGVRSMLALIDAREGKRATADSVINELERRPSSAIAGGLGLYAAARIAAALGDRERAVRILTEALRNPDNADLLIYVHREQDWFALRQYAPFRQLIATRTP